MRLPRRDKGTIGVTIALDNVIRKFHECAEFSDICPREKADAIIESVMGLDQAPTADELIEGCLLLA